MEEDECSSAKETIHQKNDVILDEILLISTLAILNNDLIHRPIIVVCDISWLLQLKVLGIIGEFKVVNGGHQPGPQQRI
jgi:hypothetical protein